MNEERKPATLEQSARYASWSLKNIEETLAEISKSLKILAEHASANSLYAGQ